MTHLLRITTMSALLALTGVAQAGFVSLVPTTATVVNVGDTVVFDLIGNFDDDPTLGGGVDVLFDDSVLGFDSLVLSAIGDVTLLRNPDQFAGLLQGIAFGDYNGIGGAGDFLIGTLSFTALGAGSSDLILSESAGIAGGFYSAVTLNAQDPDFINGFVRVQQPTSAPEPGSLALMIAGMLGLWLRSTKAGRAG